MSAPRTKPWEVASGTSAAAATDTTLPNVASAASNPAVPERPTSLTDPTQPSASYGMGQGGYGSSLGGGYGLGGAYGLRYGSGLGSSMYGNTFGGSMGGGYGSSMYGGYGGYGSSMYGGYGGYGSGMYGGGFGGNGMYGQNGMHGPGGLTEGTQATFQLIELIIGAVGGFAQMLEATYMATHLSFFTMVSLAEQFGNLKNALGSLLGIFALIKLAKKLFYKLTGRVYNNGINLKEFGKFEQQQLKIEENLRRQQSNGNKPARISFKPLLLFLAASIGLPYLLSKAIQKLNEQNQAQQQRRLQDQGMAAGTRGPIDPDSLEFAKALYDFNPENPNIEIELKRNELVAILSKTDPLGNASSWWEVRLRLGKVGYVPLNYLSIIERKAPLKRVELAPVADLAKPNPLVEEFQKGQSP